MIAPLEVIELTKIYNEKEAVKNISFKINKNEIIGILGPNGCGKTTTIGMILGLLKPSKGKILINGISIEDERVELLNNLNFISPYIELPKKLTVEQNLEVYNNEVSSFGGYKSKKGFELTDKQREFFDANALLRLDLNSLSTMTKDQILRVDPSNLTPKQLDEYNKKFLEYFE